jgi:hypothetical protein
VLSEVKRKKLHGTAALTCCAGLGFATCVYAGINTVQGPIPVSSESVIFGAADVPGATLSIALTPFRCVFTKAPLLAEGNFARSKLRRLMLRAALDHDGPVPVDAVVSRHELAVRPLLTF